MKLLSWIKLVLFSAMFIGTANAFATCGSLSSPIDLKLAPDEDMLDAFAHEPIRLVNVVLNEVPDVAPLKNLPGPFAAEIFRVQDLADDGTPNPEPSVVGIRVGMPLADGSLDPARTVGFPLGSRGKRQYLSHNLGNNIVDPQTGFALSNINLLSLITRQDFSDEESDAVFLARIRVSQGKLATAQLLLPIRFDSNGKPSQTDTVCIKKAKLRE